MDWTGSVTTMTRPGPRSTRLGGAALAALLACGDGTPTQETGTGDPPATTSEATTAGSSGGATAPTDATGAPATTDATGTTAADDTTGASDPTAATTTAATTGAACVEIDGACCPVEQACGVLTCCEAGEFCENDIYCREKCNPLESTCGAGRVCIPSTEDLFYCEEDADNSPAGAPCTCSNCCAAGLLCFPGAYVEGCEGDSCCAPACDLSDPIACPGAMESCQSIYTAGTAPAGYENLGVCALPL